MTILLEANNIRVEFGPLVAVRDVSFELEGGQLVGLVGPNGAGKTTLLRALAGLQAPARGSAKIFGKPVLGEHEVVRHHVGFAPDTPPAYEELTIDQFLRFIAGAYALDAEMAEERIDFWLEHLWLIDRRKTIIKELSRGMRQRLTLARTFLPQPHILLLDEPLSGLDPAGRIELRRVLGMLRDQGCAMIVSSHILADLEEVATHIAIIERGSVIRWDTVESLAHHHEDRRLYEVGLLDGTAKCQAFLQTFEGVEEVVSTQKICRFEYTSDQASASELLRRLIDDGVEVSSFCVIKATLEDAYLRAGIRQVD